jgi:hypothetical protein
MNRVYSLLLLLTISYVGFSQTNRMAEEIKSQKNGTSVWWAGQDSWVIKSGDLVIATDLFLENNGRIDQALPVAEGTLSYSQTR